MGEGYHTIYREKRVVSMNTIKDSKNWLKLKKAEKIQGGFEGNKIQFEAFTLMNGINHKKMKLFGMKN